MGSFAEREKVIKQLIEQAKKHLTNAAYYERTGEREMQDCELLMAARLTEDAQRLFGMWSPSEPQEA